jgi:hypothetical protein
MKLLAATILAIASFATAQAQTYYYRNQFGQTTGSIEWNGNSWVKRNQFGQITGSVEWNDYGWESRDQYQYGQGTGSIDWSGSGYPEGVSPRRN